MKLRTLLTLLLVALYSISASAQQNDEYREAVARYFSLNGGMQVSAPMLKQGLVTITNAYVQSGETLPSGYTAETLVDEYIDTRLEKDMINIYVPIFAESMTAQQIVKVCNFIDNERGRTAIAHGVQLNTDPVFEQEIMILCEATAMAIYDGKPLKPVEMTAPKARWELFDQYFHLSNLKTTIFNIIDASLNGANVDEDFKTKYIEYLRANYETLIFNCAESILSDEDLSFMVNLCKLPEYQQMTSILTEISEDPQALGLAIVECYGKWLQKQ